MAKDKIILTKKQAQLAQRMALDLRSMIHDIIQQTPLPIVASDSLMRYREELQTFYQGIEEQFFKMQQKKGEKQEI